MLITNTKYIALEPKAILSVHATTSGEDVNKSTLIDPMPFRVSPRKTTKNIFKHVSTKQPKLDKNMKMWRILLKMFVKDIPRPVVSIMCNVLWNTDKDKKNS